MKKLLFLLLQAFLCLGSAKDAGPSSLGRGYGAGNSAVSAQSNLSGDQKARLADVIYLTGVGPKLYQDFIKFWDGQKVGDFLQSVFHLAQQYPAGNIDTRNKYWKELFTYLLEREPQLYEKLKQFSRFSDFINQKGLGYAEHFDEVVEKAKENIENFKKLAQKITSRLEWLSYHDFGSMKYPSNHDIEQIIEFARENNINIRNDAKGKYKGEDFEIIKEILSRLLNFGRDIYEAKTINDLLDLGYYSLDKTYFRKFNKSLDYDNFKALIDHGFGKHKNIHYAILDLLENSISNDDNKPETDKKFDSLIKNKVKALATKDHTLRGFIEEMKRLFRLIFNQVKENKSNFYDKVTAYKFFDRLVALNLFFPDDFLNYDVIKDVYGSQKQIAFLENFLLYLKDNNIAHKIPDKTLKRLEDFANYDDNARRKITEFIRKEYKKDGNSWVSAYPLELQKVAPVKPGIIFNR